MSFILALLWIPTFLLLAVSSANWSIPEPLSPGLKPKPCTAVLRNHSHPPAFELSSPGDPHNRAQFDKYLFRKRHVYTKKIKSIFQENCILSTFKNVYLWLFPYLAWCHFYVCHPLGKKPWLTIQVPSYTATDSSHHTPMEEIIFSL